MNEFVFSHRILQTIDTGINMDRTGNCHKAYSVCLKRIDMLILCSWYEGSGEPATNMDALLVSLHLSEC